MAAVQPLGGWNLVLDGEARRQLERDALPAFLRGQRWFAGKARGIRSAAITDATSAGAPGLPDSVRLAIVAVADDAGRVDRYFLPLGFLTGPEAATMTALHPRRVIAHVDRAGVVYDALADAAVGRALLALIEAEDAWPTPNGSIRGLATSAFGRARGPAGVDLPVAGGSFEQSNSALLFGDRLILKVFRRLEPGINPDFEIGRFLAERTTFDRIPTAAGAINFEPSGGDGPPLMLGILQGLVANQGTGWDHALAELAEFYPAAALQPLPEALARAEGRPLIDLAAGEPPPEAVAAVGRYLDDAATLGRRTAELHLALASDPDDPAFAPEPITAADLASRAGTIRHQVETALAALRAQVDRLPEAAATQGRLVLDGAPRLLGAVDALAGLDLGSTTRTRVHGDYHLGQVLRAGGDFVLLDFEGEPAKSFAERVAKQPPIKDVVGMIRSFDYAAFAALFAFAGTDPGAFDRLAPWARSWRTWTSAAFLRAYLAAAGSASFVPRDRASLARLLDALTLDKALYELLYELNNRPDWVRIPLQGIAALIPPDGPTPATPSSPARRSAGLDATDVYLLAEGTHYRSYTKLGAHLGTVDGRSGTFFAVWAPNARSVSVIGDFNGWEPGRAPMGAKGAGLWEAFVPGVGAGATYKYAIASEYGDYRVEKADPFGFAAEVRPQTASIVADLDAYRWGDGDWMRRRADFNALGAPISIYEVHLGSWMRGDDGRWLTYAEVGPKLADYVHAMGFTHVEFLPIAEHPFDGSWGYQVTGYFAPTSRFGGPADFMALIDHLHAREIGVIVDWVPAHFPTDGHALGYFDGTHLYEHSDPRQGFHQDWNTFIFNFGRPEVANFLIANALFWLDKYHVDGLRVDAVASMLYRDYSRQPGEWVPNERGGRENDEAIALLRRVNERVHAEFPGVLTIAEESTAWPKVSRPVSEGGLGFDLKWDLGWMHDTLDYFSQDPIHRKYHHNRLTFRGLYAWTENFILPLSHDEVVYGKGSLLAKMPGDRWQKFAGVRLLIGSMFAQPGKKLLFMGDEFGQWVEWNHDAQLDWRLLDDPGHAGIRRWVRDLNTLYRGTPALHEWDAHPEGFRWVDADDSEQSVVGYLRRGHSSNETILVVANYTPVPRTNYRVGVPMAGHWAEILNGDAPIYGGSGQGNIGGVSTAPVRAHGFDQSVNLTLPPLALIALRSPGR